MLTMGTECFSVNNEGQCFSVNNEGQCFGVNNGYSLF